MDEKTIGNDHFELVGVLGEIDDLMDLEEAFTPKRCLSPTLPCTPVRSGADIICSGAPVKSMKSGCLICSAAFGLSLNDWDCCTVCESILFEYQDLKVKFAGKNAPFVLNDVMEKALEKREKYLEVEDTSEYELSLMTDKMNKLIPKDLFNTSS